MIKRFSLTLVVLLVDIFSILPNKYETNIFQHTIFNDLLLNPENIHQTVHEPKPIQTFTTILKSNQTRLGSFLTKGLKFYPQSFKKSRGGLFLSAEGKGVAGLGKAGGDGTGGSDKAGQQVPPEVYIALTYAGTAFLFTLSVPLILYGFNKLLNKIEDCFGCGPASRKQAHNKGNNSPNTEVNNNDRHHQQSYASDGKLFHGINMNQKYKRNFTQSLNAPGQAEIKDQQFDYAQLSLINLNQEPGNNQSSSKPADVHQTTYCNNAYTKTGCDEEIAKRTNSSMLSVSTSNQPIHTVSLKSACSDSPGWRNNNHSCPDAIGNSNFKHGNHFKSESLKFSSGESH